MGYVLSKIAWVAGQPSSLIGAVLLTGLILASTKRLARTGRRIAWAGLALLATGGFSPLANLLILPLEQRFPVPAIDAGSREYAGIIVLGGGETGTVSDARGQLALNEAGERITEGARLARLLPEAGLFFTGGSPRIFGMDAPAAKIVAGFWREMGISAARIHFEDQSRTTYENAIFTRNALKPQPGQRFVLVTSAHHMPRAMGAFRKAGLDVVAYPCDFRTAGPGDGWKGFQSFPAGLRRLDDTLKEWVGLLGYRLAGRSDDLFPAP